MNWRRFVKSCLFYFYPTDWKPLAIGTVVHSKYEIMKVLGVGGYSYAYYVCDRTTNQFYTLKQIKKHVAAVYNRDMLFKEGAFLNQLMQKEGFPYPIDNFIENNQGFVVLNYIEGTPIDVLVFEQGMQYDEKQALILLKKISQKVVQLHELNIVHHDLRLPNILINRDEIAIIDFGLAEQVKHIDQEHIHHELFKLGHFLLFLLYSKYECEEGQKESSWEEELDISDSTKKLLRRLLLIDEPFKDAKELLLFLEYHDSNTSLL
ncbi:MAG: protein kinase [Bacillaceae bacterium]